MLSVFIVKRKRGHVKTFDTPSFKNINVTFLCKCYLVGVGLLHEHLLRSAILLDDEHALA